jgi:hypothetical protein
MLDGDELAGLPPGTGTDALAEAHPAQITEADHRRLQVPDLGGNRSQLIGAHVQPSQGCELPDLGGMPVSRSTNGDYRRALKAVVLGSPPWVFVGKRGASLANSPGRFADFIREIAGLDFKLHDLRHTCATGCARLGAAESTVSRILGHKAIAGTIAVSGINDRFDRL